MKIAGKLEERVEKIVAEDLVEMAAHNQQLHTIPVPVSVLGQILTRLTQIESTLTTMEEKLTTANAELDQLDIAATDLATQAHAMVNAIQTATANITTLQADVMKLFSAVTTGSAISPATVAALNTRISGELATLQTQSAALKAALPPPTPAPNITSPLTASGTVGVPFDYEIETDTAAESFGAAGLPDGLAVDTDLGDIEGTPTTSGTFTVSLTAVGIGGPGSATLVITIADAAAAQPPVSTPPVSTGGSSPASTPSSPQTAGTPSSS